MRIDNNSIREIKVQKLQDYIDVNSKEDINLYCTVTINNGFQKPEKDCIVCLQINNIMQEETITSETNDLLIKKVKNRSSKRKILNSITFTKNYSSLGSKKTSIINFDIAIKKDDFVNDFQSKYYAKGMLDFDVFVMSKSKGIISYEKKEIDLNKVPVLNDEKLNFVKNDKTKKEIKLLNDFVTSLKIFSDNITEYAISADSKQLTELQSDLSLQNYKLFIYFSKKNKTGNKSFNDKSINNDFIEFELYELSFEGIKKYSNRNSIITENLKFKKFVDMLLSDSNFYVRVSMYNKALKKTIENNNWSFEIKKENIYDWFLGLFYNIYLPEILKSSIDSRTSNLNKNEINISFDKQKKSKLNYEEEIFDKFSEYVDIKISKSGISNKKTINNELVLKNLNDSIEEKEFNLSKEFVNFKKFQSYKGRNKNLKLNNVKENNFPVEFLKIQYKLSDDSKSFQKKVLNLKINNFQDNFLNSSIKKDSSFSSFYDLSYIVNEIAKNNTKFLFDTSANIQNSIDIRFTIEDLNVKEYYTFLGYESFEEFTKSILMKIECKIYESESELFRYESLSFLEKFYKDEVSTNNLIEKDIKNYSLFTKNYSRDILKSNNLNAEYCVKVALVRKETYNKIALPANDLEKSLLFKDSYNIMASQSFTNLEKSVNIIHSNNTSIINARAALFDILYSNDFDYTKKDFI